MILITASNLQYIQKIFFDYVLLFYILLADKYFISLYYTDKTFLYLVREINFLKGGLHWSNLLHIFCGSSSANIWLIFS